MNNYDTITQNFTKKDKELDPIVVYNRISNRIQVNSTDEAKELLNFICQLQKTSDYLLDKGKRRERHD